MLQLAAPHTWPASIFPVLTAVALAVAQLEWHAVSGIMVCVLLAISVLFQSAVNTINDYFDYVKGTDTLDNQDDPTDAVLVYNKVNPRSVLVFAIVLIALAFLLGIYCIVAAGWAPLIIALIGVLILFLYSGGKTPISYLPIGEIVSGFTFGGLVTYASYICLTLRYDPLVFVWGIPVMIGVGLIMLTNNGCDIEKDALAGRKTLPVLIGYENMCTLYHALIYVWIASICLIVLLWFRSGWIVLPFMLLAAHPLGRALLANPLKPETRGAAFAQITSLNVALGSFYAAAIFASTTGVCLL
ncbi:MAG: prenyltransferase [Eggerthellaceae bacterium]|nr:prenyltransferase [Eggerthellaceae bacterium]